MSMRRSTGRRQMSGILIGSISRIQDGRYQPRYHRRRSAIVRQLSVGTLHNLNSMLFNTKKVNSGWGYSIAIMLANVIFILFGTLVFVYIEGNAEIRESEEDYKTKIHLIQHIVNFDTIQPQLLQLQKDMCKKSNSLTGQKSWAYTGSLHYCITILSTIGYGVVSPHNYISKTISIAYALFGIPIYAVYLSYAYLGISFFFDGLASFIFKLLGVRRLSDVALIGMKLLLSNVMLWSYILILTFLWTPFQDWQKGSPSVLNDIYWHVIRFTSIGFGDEYRDIASLPRHVPSIINTLTVGFIGLPFGISITSFFFQMYRKLFGNRRKWAEVECRKLMKKNTVIKLRQMSRLKVMGHRSLQPQLPDNDCPTSDNLASSVQKASEGGNSEQLI